MRGARVMGRHSAEQCIPLVNVPKSKSQSQSQSQSQSRAHRSGGHQVERHDVTLLASREEAGVKRERRQDPSHAAAPTKDPAPPHPPPRNTHARVNTREKDGGGGQERPDARKRKCPFFKNQDLQAGLRSPKHARREARRLGRLLRHASVGACGCLS